MAGGSSVAASPPACSESAKRWVLGVTREWYLFPDPAVVRQPGVVRDGGGTAGRIDGQCTGPGQGPLLQLPDHDPPRIRCSAKDSSPASGSATAPTAATGPSSSTCSRQPRGGGGTAAWRRVVAVDQGSGFVPVSHLLANGTPSPTCWALIGIDSRPRGDSTLDPDRRRIKSPGNDPPRRYPICFPGLYLQPGEPGFPQKGFHGKDHCLYEDIIGHTQGVP